MLGSYIFQTRRFDEIMGRIKGVEDQLKLLFSSGIATALSTPPQNSAVTFARQLAPSVKYQFSDIGSSNQLSTKHKRCIFKQTRLFAGNIPERRTLANRDKLYQWVSLLSNRTKRYKRNGLEGWLFCWFPSPA